MKTFSAILGTAFVMFVSVAAMDRDLASPEGTAVHAAKHAAHDGGTTCCDKSEGMCARSATDAKGCCQKPDCCKDDCCKDGVCKDNCTCECCRTGGCCQPQGALADGQKASCCQKNGNGAQGQKEGCCKPKNAQAKKPALVPSH